jgi:hypothetical protein
MNLVSLSHPFYAFRCHLGGASFLREVRGSGRKHCLESSTLGLWLIGTLFAIVVENYWIADEIYPSADTESRPVAPDKSCALTRH